MLTPKQMSFSNFLRRAFGGEDADVAEEFDDLDKPAGKPVVDELTPVVVAESGPGNGEGIPADMADAVLAVINSQFPPALAACVDPVAQRRWLAERLGPSLEAYAVSVRSTAIRELTGDKAKIQSELEELRAERKEVSSKREEQKAALLSEQRQRRALADRNRDLENKIGELDSEIEQHKLTISSLMNKMRVAEVTDGDGVDELVSELEKLRAQVAGKDAEIAELAQKVTAAEEVIARADSILTDKDKEIADLTEKISELESAAALKQALDERRMAAGESGNTDAADAATAPRKRRGRPRKYQNVPPLEGTDSSADLEEIDWLLPGGTPAGHVGHVADPEFGYQPPKHSPAPDSDAQLTLF